MNRRRNTTTPTNDIVGDITNRIPPIYWSFTRRSSSWAMTSAGRSKPLRSGRVVVVVSDGSTVVAGPPPAVVVVVAPAPVVVVVVSSPDDVHATRTSASSTAMRRREERIDSQVIDA